ncbi:phage head closure protein [Snodgrassella sp. B3088]|uniref:phage head closure protein n=1 Tax=Snodgrassella TaxID=1193515 RepID=UPI000C1ED321|nr:MULTISPECIES: phage head closure protein [Snodgrassella]MCX8749072.1 phage head closure protein [Snodgrassella sp. B3088]PIT41864.1 hypothetical protein BHC43_00380 [Snodgrassella alvi]
MSIAAGKLDKRVLLQRPQLSKGTLGEFDKKWVNVGYLWANISYLSGREFIKNGLDSSSCSASIQVRRSSLTSNISPEWRIIYNDIIFNIQAVLPDSSHSEAINLPCTTGLNEG